NLRESESPLYPNTRGAARWRITDVSGFVHPGPQTSVTYADSRFDWKTASGRLVHVHWYEGDDAFGQRALAVAEGGIAKAEEEFGVKETNSIDFFVYADLSAFYDALGPGTRENVGGEALPELRTLFALIPPAQLNDARV